MKRKSKTKLAASESKIETTQDESGNIIHRTYFSPQAEMAIAWNGNLVDLSQFEYLTFNGIKYKRIEE